MRALVIGQEEKQAIARLVEYASQHVFSLDDIKEIMRGEQEAAGNSPEFVVAIPRGFRCVFSYEYQPSGLCRHLSVSIPDKYPHPEAVNLLMQEFGFEGTVKDPINIFWLDENERAVNILQIVEAATQ